MSEPEPNPPVPPSPGRIPAGLILLCLVAYAPLWANDFIDLDDEIYVTRNAHVTAGLTPEGFTWAWTTYHAGYWLPLVWLSLQLDGTVSHVVSGTTGLVPEVYHAQNLFWHAATTVLLFLTLARMTGRRGASALVAALFAVHPLHVESVAWATERKDVLSAFFWVLTVAAYARYAAAPSGRRYLLALSAFALGLLAKPMLVTLPCALVLLVYWPLRRFGWSAPAVQGEGGEPAPVRPGFWGALRDKIPFFILALAGGVMAVHAQSNEGAVMTLEALPVPSRVANALTSYVWYLWKTVWPSGLSVFYPHRMNNWAWTPVVLCTGLLTGVTLVALATARRAPWLIVGWLWFLGTLAPVIGFVQVGAQGRGDRFVYIPHVGLFVAVVWSAAAVLERARVPSGVRTGLGSAAVAACAIVTFIQVGYWKDPPTVWEHALAVDPYNDRAHATLGRYLMEQFRATGKTDGLEQGLEHLRAAVRIRPGAPEYEYNLGVPLMYRGELAEASEQYRKALETKPDYVDALHNLGMVERLRKNYPEAERALRRAADLAPGAADTRALLGSVLWDQGRYAEARAEWEAALAIDANLSDALAGRGRAELRAGRPEAAAVSFQAAVRSNPDYARAWSELGVAWGRLNRWDRALEAHEQALKIAGSRLPPGPELAGYLRPLALALYHSGRASEARLLYSECSKMGPEWRPAGRDAAWALATAADVAPGDAAAAVERASEVCQAEPSPSSHDLDVLAAALAAMGRFPEAVATGRDALKTAAPDQAGPIAARLALYEAGKRFVNK